MKSLIKVQPGAKEKLHLSEGDVHVEIGEGAEVTIFDHVPGSKKVVLDKGARLRLFQNRIGGESQDETLVTLMGDDSDVFSQVVFLGSEGQQVMNVIHQHVGKNTTSRMVSKGAVNNRAHSRIRGLIKMDPGSNGADGTLEEYNLLLSPQSRIEASPDLEIHHHDVKAAHAANMERVDDDKLFYLAARGIPREEAMRLIVEGFFYDALQQMGDSELEQRTFDKILSLL